MERQVWKKIVALLKQVHKPSEYLLYQFASVDIVRVILWAVLHDRPISWATRRENWPIHDRRRALPSNSTISRRYRTVRVLAVLKQIEERVLLPQGIPPLIAIVDGKPLPIGGCSKDKQAGYGRSARGKARGYKLHAIIGSDNSVLDWRVAPMNKDERTMTARMLRVSKHCGYILGDSNFDSNPLHQVCSESEQKKQLVARRRRGGVLGHHKHDPGRLRSVEILESPCAQFGQLLLQQRNGIERFFGNLTNSAGSLQCLPPWARTWKRVHRWVQGKLILTAIKLRTCVA